MLMPRLFVSLLAGLTLVAVLVWRAWPHTLGERTPGRAQARQT